MEILILNIEVCIVIEHLLKKSKQFLEFQSVVSMYNYKYRKFIFKKIHRKK